MFNILEAFKNNLQRTNPIKSERIQNHMPSRSMCYSVIDNKPLGSCIRSAYFSVKQYPASNPMGIYAKMTTEAGHLWEDWVINQYKEIGIYVNHSVKLYDPTNKLSGEIDILHYNPHTNEYEITEVKQYNGSVYQAAQGITGSKDTKPAPKDQNLLQVFTYLLMLRNTNNTQIKYVNLLYIDRSCGSFFNNFQFRVSLTTVDNKVYPFIEYLNSTGVVESYTDFRITEEAVLEKNKMLDEFVANDLIPPRDFQLKYTDAKIEAMYLAKEISTFKYNKWKANPAINVIGDWMCSYCPYGPNKEGFSTCYSLE